MPSLFDFLANASSNVEDRRGDPIPNVEPRFAWARDYFSPIMQTGATPELDLLGRGYASTQGRPYSGPPLGDYDQDIANSLFAANIGARMPQPNATVLRTPYSEWGTIAPPRSDIASDFTFQTPQGRALIQQLIARGLAR